VITDYQGREFIYKEYTPYGELWFNEARDSAEAQRIGLEHGFTGHIHDSETGLIFMNARYFDGRTSRFLSADPPLLDGRYMPAIGGSADGLLAGGVFRHTNLNTFHYGANNPLKYNDPSGEASEEAQRRLNTWNAGRVFGAIGMGIASTAMISGIGGVLVGLVALAFSASWALPLLAIAGGVFLGGFLLGLPINRALRHHLNRDNDGATRADMDAQGSRWERYLPPDDSLHQPPGGGNEKWVHPDGRERVFDPDGNVIEWPGNHLGGTFNFWNGTRGFNGFMHGLLDVVPWLIFDGIPYLIEQQRLRNEQRRIATNE
jgi:RHS repeat-associated protein